MMLHVIQMTVAAPVGGGSGGGILMKQCSAVLLEASLKEDTGEGAEHEPRDSEQIIMARSHWFCRQRLPRDIL